MKDLIRKTFLYRIYQKKKYKHLFDLRFKSGKGTYGINNLKVYLWKINDSIEIGNYCSISENVTLLASGEHHPNRVSTYPFLARILKIGIEDDTKSKGPIIIGNDVWIGYGAVILSGVKIGNGAIIAAGSYVTKDVEPFTIVGGVPARILRKRFKMDQIQQLEKIGWWNWKDEIIKERIHDFYTDVDVFINKYCT